MNVEVIESRDKEFVTEVNQLATPIEVLRQLPVHAFDETIRLNDNIAVLDDLQPTGCRGMDNIGSVDFHSLGFLKKIRQIK